MEKKTVWVEVVAVQVGVAGKCRLLERGINLLKFVETDLTKVMDEIIAERMGAFQLRRKKVNPEKP